MPRKPRYEPEEPTLDEQLEDLYEQAMADIYDIQMKAYDETGVRIKELMEAAHELADEEYEVELDDDITDDELDAEY